MKLVIFGMFRSGTSYLWWTLSKDERFKHSYYEPLHPHLLDDRKGYKHYVSYNELKDLEKYFNWNLAFNKYVMKEDEENFQLKRYLNYLIKENTLVKINRMSFRISWFKKNFPDVKCIGIIRDPRAYAYSHIRNGRMWDPIFFDLCLGDSRFNDYLDPLKDESDLVKLLAFWKICAEEMLLNMLIITIENLNKDISSTISSLYKYVGYEIPVKSILDAILAPDDYTSFWGDVTVRYNEVAEEVWKTAIDKTGIKDLMEGFGYG